MELIRRIILVLMVLCPLQGMAQEVKYTDQLRQRNAQGGVVIVHMDSELEDLVNGVGVNTNDSVKVTLENANKPVKTEGPHTKQNGYRVQIYMAGNTAADKKKVQSWARRFKVYFPSTNAYVYFSSPHWVCEVGDYKTRQEASDMLTQVRGTHQFNSASVVRSKINNFY